MTRIGWCPGGRPVAEMLTMYPGSRAVRIFVGAGKTLPTWDGPVLGPIPGDTLIHLSFKTWDLVALERWLVVMPAGRQLILTYAHEPEQQQYGDPTPEVFHARWAELTAVLAEHPRRGDLLLAPVYTRYWWQAHPGDLRWLLEVPGLDVVGWDVYNNGAGYRTPDDLLSIPRAISARTGLPYLIGELGAVRVPGDLDGTGRIAWMRALVNAASADGALTVCWFHKDEWDLVGSAAEQQTWQAITQEAAVDPYLAPSLATLRVEINARWPGRDHTSDGWIGDRAHQATRSDHNPNVRGSVNAIDVDEDGPDFATVFAAIRRHPSARYVIYEHRLYHRLRGWQSEPYSGDNPHDKHFHLSIDQTREAEQDRRPWGLLEDDMPLTDAEKDDIAARTMRAVLGAKLGKSTVTVAQVLQGLTATVAREGTSPTELAAALAGLPQPDLTSLSARLDDLTELVRAGQAGEMDAAEVVRLMGERLSAPEPPAG